MTYIQPDVDLLDIFVVQTRLDVVWERNFKRRARVAVVSSQSDAMSALMAPKVAAALLLRLLLNIKLSSSKLKRDAATGLFIEKRFPNRMFVHKNDLWSQRLLWMKRDAALVELACFGS